MKYVYENKKIYQIKKSYVYDSQFNFCLFKDEFFKKVQVLNTYQGLLINFGRK